MASSSCVEANVTLGAPASEPGQERQKFLSPVDAACVASRPTSGSRLKLRVRRQGEQAHIALTDQGISSPSRYDDRRNSTVTVRSGECTATVDATLAEWLQRRRLVSIRSSVAIVWMHAI